MNPVEEYRQCAQVTAQIDYSNKATIKGNNRAVDGMYRIVRRAAAEGHDSIAQLFVLLDDPDAAPWIAHQLLEVAEVPPEIERRCLAIIEKLAEDSLGEQWWLRDYKKRGTV